MGAAIHLAGLLQTVTGDLHAARCAFGRKRVNGAFETVEGMRRAVHHDLEGLVVVVAAGLASGHDGLLQCCECAPPACEMPDSAAVAWPVFAEVARSASDRMPTNRLLRSTTGRRRTCCSAMLRATWAVSSSS